MKIEFEEKDSVLEVGSITPGLIIIHNPVTAWIISKWKTNDHFRRVILGLGVVGGIMGVVIAFMVTPLWVMALFILGGVIYAVGVAVDNWGNEKEGSR